MTITVKTVKAASVMEPTVQIGEQFTLAIHRLGYGGMGVGRHATGLVVLVPKTIPGETIRAEVVQTRRRHLVARLLEVVTPSPLRTTPVCHHFDRCGGCHLQQLNYPEQLNAKWQVLQENLNRKDPLDIEPAPVVGAIPNLNYRNKNFYHVEDGRLGFIDPLSHRLLPIDACPCAPQQSNQILTALNDWLKGTSGEIRENLLDVLIRQSMHDGSTMVVLVFADNLASSLGKVLQDHKDIKSLSRALAGASSCALYANFKPRLARYSFGEQFVHVDGPRTITEAIGPFSLALSPSSFVQIHPAQAAALYAQAVLWLQSEAKPAEAKLEAVLDLYSGSGALSMFLSRIAESVYGVELNRQAVLDAQQSAVNNDLTNITFRTGKCERIVDKLIKQGVRFKLATLNPPRTGCDPALWPLLAKIGVERCIYISCSPPTLKRDLTLMAKHGFAAKRMLPFDMFPQTYHLEVLTVLERQ